MRMILDSYERMVHFSAETSVRLVSFFSSPNHFARDLEDFVFSQLWKHAFKMLRGFTKYCHGRRFGISCSLAKVNGQRAYRSSSITKERRILWPCVGRIVFWHVSLSFPLWREPNWIHPSPGWMRVFFSSTLDHQLNCVHTHWGGCVYFFPFFSFLFSLQPNCTHHSPRWIGVLDNQVYCRSRCSL